MVDNVTSTQVDDEGLEHRETLLKRPIEDTTQFPWGGSNPWMESYSGYKVRLYEEDALSETEFRIEDIAHSLAMNCRYNGHCKTFYSVAEHSVLVSYLVSPGLALTGLLHDATEAYISDIVKPFKDQLHNYKEIEDHLHYRLAKAFDIYTEMPKEIKVADLGICQLEADILLPSKGKDWDIPEGLVTWEEFQARTGCTQMPCMEWEEAKNFFLRRYEELTSQ